MIDKPANIESRNLASGQIAWYWRAPPKDRAKSPFKPRSLGTDQLEAFQTARDLNEKLINWRSGIKPLTGIEGTLRWLLDGFLGHRLTTAITPGLQKEYERHARYTCALKLKGGNTLGNRKLETITVKLADNMYVKLEAAHGTSIANRTLKMLRLAWDRQYVLHETTVPQINPFSKIETNSHKAEETEPATYEQLVAFISTAIAMDEIAIAFAGRVCWDMHIRPTEVFRSTLWRHWRPSNRPDQFYIGSEKRDTGGWQPLDDEGHCLFPELEDIVRMLPCEGEHMCMRKRQVGTRKFEDFVKINSPRSIVDRVKERAGLPHNIGLAAFRHGGLTELGSAGVPDTLAQARSLHKQRATLDRYIHNNNQQAVDAQKMRLVHRGKA